MKKSTVVAIIVVALFLVGGGFLALASRPNKNEETTTPDSTSGAQQDNQQNTADQQPKESTNSPANASATDEVEIEDFAFQPSAITVKKGTTVTWTNKDNVQHSIVPDTQSNAFDGSELLTKDESYSFTFNTPGTYPYHCGPHPNMKGTVVVTE